MSLSYEIVNNMSTKKVLLVEDDHEIARLIKMYLTTEGFEVDTFDRGEDALKEIEENAPDVLILDLMLPGLNGSEVCQKARCFYDGAILILTACSDDLNEVALLRLGADDFISKPVKPHVLVARIEALIRRVLPKDLPLNGKETPLKVRDIELEPHSRRIIFRGNRIYLSNAEFEMLLVLMSNVGKVVTREECCRSLRGVEHGYNDRSIDMRISTLRKKLQDNSSPHRYILTIRNKGYMMIDE